jgi:soluble lytic murein transglycosylase-like protein
MEIEDEIVRYSTKYGVDPSLARAVCMYESGGNANLTPAAGARGYFQVMPSTFRLMAVPTNIEAGIKYLGQLVHRFGQEDFALAAYNGGPGRVARGRWRSPPRGCAPLR